MRAAFAARGEHMVHQPRQKLHRQILEGERRPVEELEHKGIHAELRDRRDGGMAEGAVRLARHAGEIARDRSHRRRNAAITSTATSA